MDRSYYLHLWVKKLRLGVTINLSNVTGLLTLSSSAQESQEDWNLITASRETSPRSVIKGVSLGPSGD